MRVYKVLLTAIQFAAGCSNHTTMKDKDNIYAFRLKPGDELKKGIEIMVLDHHNRAGWIATCVGGFTRYNIRFANQPDSAGGEGNIVYTTAEIIIATTDKYHFTREKDGSTPWDELQVKEN